MSYRWVEHETGTWHAWYLSPTYPWSICGVVHTDPPPTGDEPQPYGRICQRCVHVIERDSQLEGKVQCPDPR